MAENEIKEFVAKTIEQIKAGLPAGCGLNGNFDFEIGVITTKGVRGGLNIKLVNINGGANTQQVHKIRFSISDKKSQKENMAEAVRGLRKLFTELLKLDKKQKKEKRRK